MHTLSDINGTADGGVRMYYPHFTAYNRSVFFIIVSGGSKNSLSDEVRSGKIKRVKFRKQCIILR